MSSSPVFFIAAHKIRTEINITRVRIPTGRRQTSWLFTIVTNWHNREKIQLVVRAEINPLSPNSDRHQFSPNNIHTLSRD